MRLMLNKMKGLKYPDEAVIKYFFKEIFNKVDVANVLELGCANGNNLDLFYQYNWNVTGLDFSERSINNAQYNFSYYEKENNSEFILCDLSSGIPELNKTYDVILLPNILYYLDENSMRNCLRQIYGYANENCKLFIRMRSPDDYRFGKGIEIGNFSYQLDYDETDEKDCINVFYTKNRIERILREELKLTENDCSNLTYLDAFMGNMQNGKYINNVDYIIWGNIKTQ